VQPSQFAGVSSRGAHRAGSNVAVPVNSPFCGDAVVDIIFIVGLLVLYAATHWLIVAFARLGSAE
jgi:hypothetical protein